MISPTLNDLDDQNQFEQEGVSDGDSDGVLARPYDPTQIRVEPKMFSLRNILDMIDEGEIDLAPDFQRLRVWSPGQKSRLIESVLLRIPLPAFYFAADHEGRLQVVDGVQRLSTIHDFVRSSNSFSLVDLEYLSDEVSGRKFDALKNTLWAKRIHGTQIVVNVIDPQTPTAVKFDIFKRINTGGTPLNSQEIRHCMSRAPSRELLKDLTSTREFNSATGNSLATNVRMADREVTLRVLAFSMFGLDRYYQCEGLDQFLNDATQIIDNDLNQMQINQYSYHFTRAMRVAYGIFGEHAFRKWPNDHGRRMPINRAIFEAVGTTLLMTPEDQLRPQSEIRDEYRRLCSEDHDFISSVTQSTASAGSVALRFDKIRRAFVA